MDDKDELQHKLLSSLHMGVYMAAVFALGFSALTVYLLYEYDGNTSGYDSSDGWYDFACLIIGLFCGIGIGEATEYFTSYAHSPTQSITKSGVTGPATVIIQGLGIGMLSSVPPVILVAVAVMSCSALSGVYGAALAAVGMLSTLGVTLATDAYGPVADNAGGIAEMAHLPSEVRERTDALDALGNTTAATGKGFAVGSAVLTALAFMNAFSDKVKNQLLDDLAPNDCPLSTNSTASGVYAGMSSGSSESDQCYIVAQLTFNDFFSLTNPLVLSGLLIGAMLPFLFAALTMLSVGKAASGIILEVRDQLIEEPKLKHLVKLSEHEEFDYNRLDEDAHLAELGGKVGLTEDKVQELIAHKDKLKEIQPKYDNCVKICTMASLKEMILPGVMAIFTPIGVGLLVGARCLGGLLMGAIASGFLLAVMMNNAGGAWDNSKKWIENDGPPIGPGGARVSKEAGKTDRKMKEWHSSVVTGDTVGDPFKDTYGPALNILIKLMSVLSLTCGSIFRNDWETWGAGIIVLVLETVLCAVAFYYVWWIDTTGDIINNAGAPADVVKDEVVTANKIPGPPEKKVLTV